MKSFWDHVAFIYDINELANKKVNDQIMKAVENEVPEGSAVLDCAAGTGMLSLSAAKKAKKVLSTDLSKEMLITAMKKARKQGVHNIAFAKRNIMQLKDADESYDVVMAGNVLHLLDDPETAFAELVRVTKKGGKIIIPTYLRREASLIAKLLLKAYRLIGFRGKNLHTEEYVRFIAQNAEKCGCTGYSTRLLLGNIPAGFSVIRKGE
ncbi:MAG: class I SAM-dependent methyltransferase [Oscillospiraceae bacterium]|nr:class I SAM-dependent methyltransferase [Oscillospiraceae bacterium]